MVPSEQPGNHVAVIGLGSMGWGAAISLLRSGLPTIGVDVRKDVLARFEGEGGTIAAMFQNSLLSKTFFISKDS